MIDVCKGKAAMRARRPLSWLDYSVSAVNQHESMSADRTVSGAEVAQKDAQTAEQVLRGMLGVV